MTVTELARVREAAVELAIRADMMERTPEGLCGLRECHARRVRVLARRLARAQEAIDAMPDARARCVLTLYYIDGQTIEQIAEVLDYDPRHVRRLRRMALDMIV